MGFKGVEKALTKLIYGLVREAKVRAVGGGEALSGDGDLHLPQHLGGRGEKN